MNENNKFAIIELDVDTVLVLSAPVFLTKSLAQGYCTSANLTKNANERKRGHNESLLKWKFLLSKWTRVVGGRSRRFSIKASNFHPNSINQFPFFVSRTTHRRR